MDFPPFASLRAFEAVGRLGGIRRAADAIGIDHAVVSRHLRALEGQLGLTLYDRGAARLTPAGAAYHARIAPALTEIAAATAALGPARAELRIWCSPGIATPWLTARLAGFAAGRDQVLDLRAADRPPDFVRDEADGDIRYHSDAAREERTRDLRAVVLARPPVFPLAAPTTAARLRGRIGTAADLAALPLIEEGDAADWRLWFAAQGLVAAPTVRVARYGNAHLALAAARAGQGIALGNHYLVADDLAAGRLVPLRKDDGAGFAGVALGCYMFRTDGPRWSSPALARFRRWLVEQFRRDPAPSDQVAAAPAR